MRTAIYGFAGTARLFWLALLEALSGAGWMQSVLEPALFKLRRDGQSIAMTVSHADDVVLARMPNCSIDEAMGKAGQNFEWKSLEKKYEVYLSRPGD